MPPLMPISLDMGCCISRRGGKIIAAALVPIKVGSLGAWIPIFWGKGVQCAQCTGDFRLGGPR